MPDENGSSSTGEILTRIASELQTPDQIVSHIYGDVRPRDEVDREYVAPSTDTQRTISEIWAEFLGYDRVGIHDDFFYLGGHSLMATQVLSQLQETFGIEIPMITLFIADFTVAEVAKATDQALALRNV